MIKDMQPLNISEVKKILGSLEDTEKKKQLGDFIKKFSKKSSAKDAQIKDELNGLGLLKVKQENIVKIIDLMPEDASDLNKIFTDIALDEDETNKILDVVKKYK